MQAKLKSFHEVVVRNRLEHLRKRQRDEALQAQEELLEGVATNASRGVKVAPVAESVEDAPIPYDRSMSPPLINITSLPYDERQVDIVLEADDRHALVRLVLLVV